MANKSHSGLSRQCRVLSINRSSVYYRSRPISTDDLEMMKRVDTEYMQRPTSGNLIIRDVFARQSHKVNRKRIDGYRDDLSETQNQQAAPGTPGIPVSVARPWYWPSGYGCPEIFNTDQGYQFTSTPFTNVLKDNGIKISMDGRGRFLYNIFIERLWWQ